jgi:hypothetical protein
MQNQQEDPTSSRLLHHDEFAFANAATSPPFPTSPSTQTTVNMPTFTSSTRTNYVSNNQTIYPMVEVVAPATLIAGYTFDVDVNHQIYTVTVVSLRVEYLFPGTFQRVLCPNVLIFFHCNI